MASKIFPFVSISSRIGGGGEVRVSVEVMDEEEQDTYKGELGFGYDGSVVYLDVKNNS
jgi:hypothetical protein